MSELLCTGTGITIVWRLRNGTIRLMRVLVDRVGPAGLRMLSWRTGVHAGMVRLADEGTEWVHGHGPQARAALIAARKLAGLD